MMFELVDLPAEGRRFAGSAVARLADCSPAGRMRLDAIARVLQDVSDDDARDAGFGDFTWVVRRTVLRIDAFPTYLEPMEVTTWCAGFGAAWAERRLRLRGESGAAVDAATLWVHVQRETLRPARMPADFLAVFGPSAGGRTVPSRTVLPAAPAEDTVSRPWPLRFTDFDVLGHVNNAAYLEPVEEELSGRRDLRAPLELVIEHGDPIEHGDDVRWSVTSPSGSGADGGFDGWLTGPDGPTHASVRVSAL